MENKIMLEVEIPWDGERLDVVLADQISFLSRSIIKTYIKEGRVLVNKSVRKASYLLHAGELVEIEVPPAQELTLIPQNIPIEIIYQDQDIAIISKPQGLVVHPAHGNWDGTLVNALLYHLHDLSGINGKLRPGIVHRLDKDTSGVMVVAKNDYAHNCLAKQIKDHTINREYMALVHGIIREDKGLIDAPIGRSKDDRKKMAIIKDGRPSQSEYQVVERFRDYTLVRVKLLTGRTHQIRVHFAFIKHSVVGDPLYGSGRAHFGRRTQILHACLLGINHPRTEKYLEFRSELPEYFQDIILQLRRE